MKHFAFTMLELIIVIIVAGILAAVMIPRLERDNLRMAANQVVRHIQYTQHLSMVNDVYDADDVNWSRRYWKIAFRTA
ncbi:MAG: type II secretion system protein [Sulfurimonadaceae bacterium]